MKRGPSLNERSVRHNEGLVRHDSLSLFHVTHPAWPFKLGNNFDDLTPGDVASPRRKILRLHWCLQLSEERNKGLAKREDLVVSPLPFPFALC
uniref:Uncharacterized protein n=1 Tax=Catagonus wagneri TaxID=51154 RepID=A0A8C3W829_9CETA